MVRHAMPGRHSTGETLDYCFVIPAEAGIHPSLILGADRVRPVILKLGPVSQRSPDAGI